MLWLNPPNIHFAASNSEVAQAALTALTQRYGQVPRYAADMIVALGGDGFMLQTLHDVAGASGLRDELRHRRFFLMNDYNAEGLIERLDAAEEAVINPLAMRAETIDGQTHQGLAINEVSLLRAGPQAAKLKISVNGKVRMEELICDGAIVATPRRIDSL